MEGVRGRAIAHCNGKSTWNSPLYIKFIHFWQILIFFISKSYQNHKKNENMNIIDAIKWWCFHLKSYISTFIDLNDNFTVHHNRTYTYMSQIRIFLTWPQSDNLWDVRSKKKMHILIIQSCFHNFFMNPTWFEVYNFEVRIF